MDGCAHFTIGFGDQLSFQNAVTNPNNRLRRFANVLFDWQDELRRNWYFLDRLRRRRALMSWQAQAAVERILNEARSAGLEPPNPREWAIVRQQGVSRRGSQGDE